MRFIAESVAQFSSALPYCNLCWPEMVWRVEGLRRLHFSFVRINCDAGPPNEAECLDDEELDDLEL